MNASLSSDSSDVSVFSLFLSPFLFPAVTLFYSPSLPLHLIIIPAVFSHSFLALSLSSLTHPSLPLPPTKILFTSHGPVSLLRAIGARRVRHVPPSREKSKRKPPPIHHREDCVFKLGSNSEHPLLPAGLEALSRHHTCEQLTSPKSSQILNLSPQVIPAGESFQFPERIFPLRSLGNNQGWPKVELD